jgi:hypothetical protein
MFMKKAVISSSLSLVISVIVIVFIISIGYYEINSFLENRERQIFTANIGEITDNIDYLMESNAAGSFLQTRLKLPGNQTIIFDNSSNNLTLTGVFNQNISINADLFNYLKISQKGDYVLTICYDCNASKEYLVVIR